MSTDRELVAQWLKGLGILHRSHFAMASRCQNRHTILGISIIVLSATVGSAVFGSLESSTTSAARIAVGMLSMLAAILASLQTFLKFSERAESHKAAAARYGVIRRELEQALAVSGTGPVPSDVLNSIRNRWDVLDSESPTLPKSIREASLPASRRNANYSQK